MVALVRGVHGLNGALRVEVLTDRPEARFKRGATLFREGSEAPLRVIEGVPVADGPGWRIRLAEAPDRKAAEAFRGAYLEALVPVEAGAPGADSWLWHEVVGLAVLGRDGEELGTVTDIYRVAENDVYVGPRPTGRVRRAGRARLRRLAPAQRWGARRRCRSSRPAAGPPGPAVPGAAPAQGRCRPVEHHRDRPGRCRGSPGGRRGGAGSRACGRWAGGGPGSRRQRHRGGLRRAMGLEIEIVTLFPAMIAGPLADSIPGRIQERGLATIRVHDLREWGLGRHRSVDDSPYGGGPGMIFRPEPVAAALADLRRPDSTVILLDPAGEVFGQARAGDLAGRSHLIFVCPRYEGIDERIRSLVDLELSIGDFVLTGGELAALVVIDALIRLLPGAIDAASIAEESFTDGLLEYPQYTRPPVFDGESVPAILSSGDHGAVRQWRRREALRRTLERRPDLLVDRALGPEDRALVREIEADRRPAD